MPLPPTDFSRFLHQPDNSGIGDLFSNYYKGFELGQTPERLAREKLAQELQNKIFGVQAQYAEPMAQAGLEAAQQQNKYNPRLWEEQLANSIAHRGLYGAQAQEHELNAKKQEFINSILQQYAGGAPGAAIEQGAPGGLMAPGVSNQINAPGGNYLGNAVVAHALGIPQHHPHITPNGEIVSFDPLTGQPKIQSGLITPEQSAEMTEKGKLNAQEKNTLINEIESSYAQEPAFNRLMEIINTPEFYQGTGALNSRIRRLTDDKEVNAIAGELDYLLGDIVNKASKQFGARLNQSEYKALQRMKGSTSQNPYEIRSKIMLMNALNKWNREVKTNYYRNLESGMNKLDAKEKAYKQANYNDVSSIVKMDDLAYKAAHKLKSDYGSVMAGAQRFADENNISVEEALKMLGEKNGK